MTAGHQHLVLPDLRSGHGSRPVGPRNVRIEAYVDGLAPVPQRGAKDIERIGSRFYRVFVDSHASRNQQGYQENRADHPTTGSGYGFSFTLIQCLHQLPFRVSLVGQAEVEQHVDRSSSEPALLKQIGPPVRGERAQAKP